MSYLQMPNGSRAPMVHPCHDPRHRVLLGAGEDGQNFRRRCLERDWHFGTGTMGLNWRPLSGAKRKCMVVGFDRFGRD
jgi:hypothetical protein